MRHVTLKQDLNPLETDRFQPFYLALAGLFERFCELTVLFEKIL